MSPLAFGTRFCVALLCVSALNTAKAASLDNPPAITDLIRDRQDRLLEQQHRCLEALKDLPGKAGTYHRA